MCQISCVTCHVSHVTCHVSNFTCHESLFSTCFFQWKNLLSLPRSTTTLLACTVSSTNTMKFPNFDTFLHFWVLKKTFLALFATLLAFLFKQKVCDMCHKSHVTCHISHVTFNVRPVINANSHRPSPADSLIVHSRLVLDIKNL